MDTVTHAEKVGGRLGGRTVLQCSLKSPLDVHRALVQGLPAAALDHFLAGLTDVRTARHLHAKQGPAAKRRPPGGRLKPFESWQLWKLADLLTSATTTIGSQEEAEIWLGRPALALGQHRPIDLMVTPPGFDLVTAHLARMAYGVYT